MNLITKPKKPKKKTKKTQKKKQKKTVATPNLVNWLGFFWFFYVFFWGKHPFFELIHRPLDSRFIYGSKDYINLIKRTRVSYVSCRPGFSASHPHQNCLLNDFLNLIFTQVIRKRSCFENDDLILGQHYFLKRISLFVIVILHLFLHV